MLKKDTTMPLIISVILCNLHLSLVISQSPPICEYCPEQNGIVMEVQCNDRNYTNFPLATDLPENTSLINFKNNNVQQLPNQTLGVIRMKVWNIDLSGNVIDQLLEDKLGKAFPNISYLDLSKNEIRLLSQHSFQHLTKLYVLHLSYNKLASISQGSFSHLLWLSWLDVRHNKLNDIIERKTGWPKRLEYLYLSYNRLRTIPPLPTKASVSLISNPIFCGCDSVVNKKITETLIKVNCHQLDNFRKAVEIQRVVKFDKYRSSVNTCKPATILKFSSLVVEGQIVLTCVITTSGLRS